MIGSKIRDFLIGVSYLIVAGALLRSAVYHIENPYAFLRAVDSYEFGSRHLSIAVGSLMPFLLLAIAVALLLFPTYRVASLKIAGFVYLVFSVVQITAIARGLEIDCGCFGASESMVGVRSLLIPLSLAALSVGLVVFSNYGASDKSSGAGQVHADIT